MTAIAFDPDAIDEIFVLVDQQQKPGAAVAIAIEGTPVYRKGFGLADIERPVPLTPAMRMRIASTTKHFTCLAYLLLCEEGRADLDDPIGRYVPWVNSRIRNVTVRQLMGHTSGIRDIVAIIAFFNGLTSRATDRDMAAYYRDIDDMDFGPGTRWSYNNGAYVLLTLAIEHIAGQSLDSLFRERLFEPVGMHDTMMRRWDDDFVSNSATLHAVDATGQYCRDTIGLEQSGAGGIVSTMDDMLRWLAHMEAPVVGSARSWAIMRTPQRLSSGTSTGYGLGLRVGKYRGVETLHHSGGVLGGNSQMMKLPALGLDISIAVNRPDLDSRKLANQIIDACVIGLDRVDPPAPPVATGYFLTRLNRRVVELTERFDRQVMGIDGAGGVGLVEDVHGYFQLDPSVDHLQQALSKEDDVLYYTEFGVIDPLDPLLHEHSEWPAGVHTFASVAIGVRLVIEREADDVILRSSGSLGQMAYRLEALNAQLWKGTAIDGFEGEGLIVAVAPDHEAITVSGARLAGIEFLRAPG